MTDKKARGGVLGALGTNVADIRERARAAAPAQGSGATPQTQDWKRVRRDLVEA